MPAVIDPLHWPLRKHLLWLLPALLIKGVFFLYFINDTAALEHMGRWALYTSDTVGYVGPGENLYTYGRYEDDHRMPGFAMLFYFLRHFLSTGNAADAITVLQWLFSCVGMYALALTVLMLGAPWRWFLFTYAALISSLLVARLEVDLMTDSFCTSALALHASFLIFHLRGGNRWWLPIAGLMLTWAVFLRPIYAVLLPLEVLFLLMRTGHGWKARMRMVVGFLLPWVVIDGAWIVRNYTVYHEVRPLTNDLYPRGFSTAQYYAMIQFTQAYGGNNNYWDPTSDLRWYGMRELQGPGRTILVDQHREPQPYLFTSQCNMDSLLLLRSAITRLYSGPIPEQEYDSLLAGVWERTTRYRLALQRERPFQYHVTARLRLLRHLVVHSGSSVIFSKPMADLAWWEQAAKLYQSALYWFAMVVGSAGAVWVFLRRRRDLPLVLLSGLVLYGIFIHPVAMRICEIRYLVPTFPISVLAAVLWCWMWVDGWRRRWGVAE